MKLCAGCDKELAPEFRFCPYCGTSQTDGVPVREARKVVSILFCDLVGSTSAGAQLDSEEVSEVFRLYHRAARSIVEDHGGIVEKFVGDGVFAVFGIPVVHEDDAERSVRAALAICEAAPGLPGLGEDILRVRCGVTTGEVLVSVGVEFNSGEGFVVGTAANVAGRVQGLAPAGGVLVDEETHRLTKMLFDYEALDPTTVKGVPEPFRTYLARAPVAAVRTVGRIDLGVPMVGREQELARLVLALDEAASARRSALLVVSGDPGLGKSRLLSALHETLLERDQQTSWRLGRSLPYGDGVGTSALSEIVKSHAGIATSDDVEKALAKLEAVMPAGDYGDWIRRRLSPMLGFEPPSAADRDETVAACIGFLETVSQVRPSVVVFEDVHWADDATLALLSQLVDTPAAAPLLVVATTRPELFDRGGPMLDRIGRRVIELSPLSDDDIATLAASLLGGAALSPELKSLILGNAGGNALYAGELVQLLDDRGALVEVGGSRQLAPGATTEIPSSTQALIAARLDILRPETLSILCDASVIGETFWVGTLAAASRLTEDEVLLALEELTRRHHVAFVESSGFSGEKEARFTHILVRDAAYAQLTHRDRAEKHLAVARWIEQAAGDHIADVVDVLAHHTSTALDLTSNRGPATPELRASALRYCTLAAERNVDLDTHAAGRHLARAIELSQGQGLARTKLRAIAGRIALNEDRPAEAAEELEQTVQAFKDAGDTRAAARTMISLAYVYQHIDNPRGFGIAEEAVAMLEDGPPCRELVDALALRAGAKTVAGDSQLGIDTAERAFALADELGIERPSVALGFRGVARCQLGDVGGIDDLRQAAELAASRGEGRDAAIAYVSLQLVEHVTHGPAAALETGNTALAFSAERGLREMVEASRISSLEPLLDLGRLEEILALGVELERRAEEVGSVFHLIAVRSSLIRAWAHSGDGSRIPEVATWLAAAVYKTGSPGDLCGGLAACAIGWSAIGDEMSARALIAELLVADVGSRWDFALRLPSLVRAAVRAEDNGLARRLIDATTHRSPYAAAAVPAARGATAELEAEHREAAQAYFEGARRFAGLGVPHEQWLALLGAERSLRACGETADADASAAAAADVFETMTSSAALAVGSGPHAAAAQSFAKGASSEPTK
jgi:class 3 adenylate cyclase